MGGGAGGIADGGGEAVVGDGDGAGGMLPAVAVKEVDQGGPLAVGYGQGGHGDGIVVFGEDEPAGPGWVEGRHPATWKVSVVECFAFSQNRDRPAAVDRSDGFADGAFRADGRGGFVHGFAVG